MVNTIINSTFTGLIAYILLLFAARIMGRKLISQMTFFNFGVAVTLGSLTANLGMGKDKSSLSAAIVIIVFTILAVITAYLHVKSFNFRKLVNSEPLTIIENGKIINDNMKKARFNMNELAALLRQKNCFNIADVEFAILETDGELSVLPRSQKQPLTPSDLNISTNYKGLTKDMVIDGNILHENLQSVNLTEQWLMNELSSYGIKDVKEAFYVGLDSSGKLFVSKYNRDKEKHGEHGIE